MGCQKESARQIVEHKGDYLLAVKDNHKTLHEDIRFFFDDAIAAQDPQLVQLTEPLVEADHGRVEIRACGPAGRWTGWGSNSTTGRSCGGWCVWKANVTSSAKIGACSLSTTAHQSPEQRAADERQCAPKEEGWRRS